MANPRKRKHYIETGNNHKYKWVYPPQRDHDQHIMDMFLDIADMQVQDMNTLNYVRYYTESTTLADIATIYCCKIKREFISPEKFCREEDMSHRQNPTQLPGHGQLDKSHYRTWRKALIDI
eukprot:2276885-Ditylum_brightwellii.AAC.1